MDRKDFLKLIGTGAATVLIAGCIQSCSKDGGPVDFTLDLTATENAALNTNGGYVYNQGVIIARTTSGNFVAVSQACTHDGVTVKYDKVNDRFHCDAHGSNFSDNGGVLTGPANSSLRQYQTTLSGTSLRVFS